MPTQPLCKLLPKISFPEMFTYVAVQSLQEGQEPYHLQCAQLTSSTLQSTD